MPIIFDDQDYERKGNLIKLWLDRAQALLLILVVHPKIYASQRCLSNMIAILLRIFLDANDST